MPSLRPACLALLTALAGLAPARPDPADGQQLRGAIVAEQAPDQWRASKLVGVSVYDAAGAKVGSVSDVLLDRRGMAQVVVIDIGGFLGIRRKAVGIRFDAVKWVAHEETTHQSYNAPPKTSPFDIIPRGAATKSATDASMGYPERAIIGLTRAELNDAPAFRYASATPFTTRTQIGPAGPLNTPAGPGAPE